MFSPPLQFGDTTEVLTAPISLYAAREVPAPAHSADSITGYAIAPFPDLSIEGQLLRCQELNLRLLAEAPVGMLVYAEDGQCVLASEAAAKIVGGTQAELHAQNFHDIAAWRTGGISALMQRAIAERTVQHDALHYTSTFGKKLWLDIRITPVSISAATFYLVVIDDISEQKLAQMELARNLAHQEERIAARTNELETANLRLRHEIDERERIATRTAFQAELLQNVTDAIIATDMNFCVTEWNRAAEQIYGLGANEAIGKQINALLATEYVHLSEAEVAHAFLKNGSWRGEVTQRHNGGERIVVMSSVNLVRNQEGHPIGVVAVNRDVTADRAAEARLNTLTNAIEQSPTCVVITNTVGEIEYVNPVFTELTGYTFEEVKGKNPRIIKSGETPSETYRDLWRTILAGNQWQGELHNRAKDGRLFWEHARISPVFNRAGEITNFIAIKEDITARKQREREQSALLELAVSLREANRREDLLPAILIQSAHLIGAPVAVFNALDPESGDITVEALLRDGELHTGLAIPITVDKDIYANIVCAGNPLSMDDILTNPTLPMVDFVGEERALYCAPLVAHGETLGVLCLLREAPFTQADARLILAAADMAAVALQRTSLYDKVVRYNIDLEQEVANRTRELAAANARLQELDQLKSKFVSDVTHELRTPVTNIGLYLKLLERKPEKLPEYVGVLAEQAERLRVLVKDTLDLSKLDQGAATYAFEDVDMSELTHSVVTAHAARAESLGLELTFAPQPHLPCVRGDRERLTQVITNLVANALNYTPSGQVSVKIALDSLKRNVCLVVSDTGCGIHEEDLVHLFNRFYRGKREQMAPVPGTGLGLAIVKEIVEQHGGTISVATRVGEGSTFTITLPIEHLNAQLAAGQHQ